MDNRILGHSFIDNLQTICNQKGESISSIVEKLGGSKSNITYWKKGSYPNGEFIIQLAKYLDISTDYLLGMPLKANYLPPEERRLIRLFRNAKEAARQIALYTLQEGQLSDPDEIPMGEETEDPAYSVTISILGRAAAGSPIEMIEDYEQIEVHDPLIKKGDFAVIASGDSMIDEGINDGDIVIVRKQLEPAQQGQLSLVAVADSSTIKRFYYTEDGYMLRPANPKYEKQFYPRSSDVRVLGKVVKVIPKNNK